MYNRSGKVIIDWVGSVFLFLLLSWVFVLIFFLYIFSFEFPFLYKSVRIGKSGGHFTMMKFRTLKINEQLPLKQRQFWLGKFLRATNLDELPQLWNVLKGEMSLVGPRPLPEAYEPLLSAEHKKRHTVLPGITGLAQVNGKNTLSWDKKFEFDLNYVQNVSFWLDAQILFKTVGLMLRPKKDVSLDEKPLGAEE